MSDLVARIEACTGTGSDLTRRIAANCPVYTEQDLRRAITTAKRNLTRVSNDTPGDTERLAALEQQLDTAFRRLDAFLSQQPTRQPWSYLTDDAA